MRRFFLLWLFCGTVLGLQAGGSESLESVLHAKELLGDGAWSRIVRVTQVNPRNGRVKETYALVFEFSEILWFYRDEDGTQSFSLHLKDLAREKADFSPLLHRIVPQFTSFEIVDQVSARARKHWDDPLPNGCFIESMAALKQRLRDGETVLRARLLSYYLDLHGAISGHTVLAYETPAGAFMVDPLADPRPWRVGPELSENPVEVAQKIHSDFPLIRARWIEAPVNLNPAARMAKIESRHSTQKRGDHGLMVQ